ncbi:MAG: enoyl-CoA hydratase/isomerase family protein [Segniliparus sp.]|uniref:enoyl-CoA hydratase/isomerase family protein n=1 Tax=Segniliparus sp. TaxID=2804064 RepID=UPI003F31FA49
MTASRLLSLETLRLEQDGPVLTARYFDKPPCYATPALLRDLDSLTKAVDRDRSVRAVVLTGGIEGRFLTHADPRSISDGIGLGLPPLPIPLLRLLWGLLSAWHRVPGALRATERLTGPLGGPGKGMAWLFRWHRVIVRMNRSSAVYIAAINGPAAGGGHEISLACDLRYVSDSPHIRLGQIETLAGLIPGGGGTQRLPKMIGTARSLEHILFGTAITADQALALGLVNDVVAEADLVRHAQEKGRQLAQRFPASIRETKRNVYFGTAKPLSAGLRGEVVGFLHLSLQPHMRSLVDAFAEDEARLGESPLVAGMAEWVGGTRVDISGRTRTT